MKKLTSFLISMILVSLVLVAQKHIPEQIVKNKENKQTMLDVAPGIKKNPNVTTFTDDLFDHLFRFHVASGYGEYGVVYFNDYIYSSCGAGFGFYCYGLDGTYYGNFSVSGGPKIMDMCSDGTYVYGSPASAELYEMYFSGASGILISTYSIPVITKAIAYDKEYDGFWANKNSSDITLYDRAGCILNSFPCTIHRWFNGLACLNEEGKKWLYGFSRHGGVSPSVIVQIDPHSGQETGVTFDASVYASWQHNLPGGLDAFDTYAPGYWTLLGSIQSYAIFGVNGGTAGHPINFDLKLTEIIEPNTGLDLSTENIVIDVKNCGVISQSNFKVRYRVKGSDWIVEECQDSLAIGESMEYTFSVPYDFSSFGTYYIEAEVLLPGDDYPDNNYSDKTIENMDETLYCNYSIVMWDDHGDGWNGGFVQIFDNGVECFNGFMSPCFGPETFEFFAINNSFLSSVFTLGGWAHDCSYYIYDHEGNLIFEDGYGEEEPTGGDIGYFFCITPDFDACINEIILPDNGINLGEELVTVSILNNGMLEFSDFQVGFSIDNGAMIMETVVGPLSPGDSIEYTFTEFADLSAAGSHTIKACTFLDSDEYRDNDCIVENIHNLIQTGNQTINLSENFQFVSSRVIPTEPDMEIVAQEIITDGLYYIRNSQGYMLRKIGPFWVNGIGDWSTNEGYLIKTSKASQFTIEGNILPSSIPIYVLAGFQFVSYLPLYEIDALEAFNSIISDSLIYIRDSDSAMLTKIGPNWINGIGNCIPGEAYLIKTLSDDTLIYPFMCGKPFIDLRDGQAYNTVQIGDQCWMAENLNIGEKISYMNQTNNGVIEKYCIYNPGNCDEYGGLYQWNEMMEYSTTAGIQGICPNGWHVPTKDEWTALSDYLGGSNVAGGKMKEAGTLHWQAPNTGATNESGFTALGDGRSGWSKGRRTWFWTSSYYGNNDAWIRELGYNYATIYGAMHNIFKGYSVRCIKDNSIKDNLSIKDYNHNFDFSDTKINSNKSVHFICKGGNPAEPVYTVYFDGLNIGDEVAVFDGEILTGAGVVQSENIFENAIPVFSNLNKPGNKPTIKVWKKSENAEYISTDYTFSNPYGDAWTENVFPEEDGEYSLIHFSAPGISDENENNDISIYPNPSKGIFNISLEGIIGDIQIKVLDLRGKEYYNFELCGLTSTQLDLSDLTAGVYFINFNGKNFSQVKKIVIQ